MIELMSAASTLTALELVARAGGGGSGGGEDGAAGIALLGYLPCHFVSSQCAKHISVPFAYIVGSIVAGLIAIFAIAIFLTDPFASIAILIGAIVGVITGAQNVFGKIRIAVKKAKERVTVAASKDSAWQEAALQQTITDTFTRFQNDWSRLDLNNIRGYTTPRYFHHVSLMLAALHAMGRQNVVADIRIQSQFIADLHDNADNSQDRFTAVITAKTNDKLLDSAAQKEIYTDTSSFTEYWHFVRDGHHKWRLDGIEQATADPAQLHGPIMQFATAHNMYFSLDWGWLLLPQRGQLFSQARFKSSDINNHVIGQWDGILVQLYTYRQVAYSTNYPTYQIAQITLPKSYGGIIIKRKQLINITPRGYQKITFEWPDFNKRYVVFATDMDKVTSFELLNPKFMADLYDKQLKVNIEVVDNVVYLYSKMYSGEAKYPEMMQILQQAFRELKM